MTSTCNNRDQLSAEGVMSNDYKVWKEETLANQTGHIEALQTTGLWQHFNEGQMVKRERDENHFMIELAPGCRMMTDGDLMATWGCPKWKGDTDNLLWLFRES